MDKNDRPKNAPNPEDVEAGPPTAPGDTAPELETNDERELFWNAETMPAQETTCTSQMPPEDPAEAGPERIPDVLPETSEPATSSPSEPEEHEAPPVEPAETLESPPDAGTRPLPVAVSLSCPAAEGAEIRYTLDGAPPDETSLLYEPGESLILHESTVLRAGAYEARDAEVSARPEAKVGEVPPEPERLEAPAAEPAEPAGVVGISPEAGAYPASVTVTLSCPTKGAEVRYTLDGGEPDESSPVYDPGEGLLLRKSAVLKARAYKKGHAPGAVSEVEYQVRAPVWQEKEPENRADEVDHEVAAEARDRGWRLAGASVRGKLHAHRALWRDDSFAFDFVDGWAIIAVSDGAGSVPLSRVGSRLACEHALEHLRKRLAGFALISENKEGLQKSEGPRLREFLAGAAGAALGAIRRKAGERSLSPEDFAGTLLVVAQRAWRGRQFIGVVQVGDGSTALLEWDGGVTLLGVADHGEHSSETRFLTTRGVEAEFMNRVRFSVKDRLRCVAVMSDGVSDDFFPEEKRLVELFLGEDLPGMSTRDGRPVRGVMGTVTAAPDPAAALLEWLRYEKRGSSDDRTLVLFWDER